MCILLCQSNYKLDEHFARKDTYMIKAVKKYRLQITNIVGIIIIENSCSNLIFPSKYTVWLFLIEIYVNEVWNRTACEGERDCEEVRGIDR